MAKRTLQLIRVVIRGNGLPNDVSTLGGVEYRRENGSPAAIYFTLLKPKWKSALTCPAQNNEHLKVVPLLIPFSRSVGVEFCGSSIDTLVAAAAGQETVAGAVLQIKPLLDYFQQNFSVS